MVKIIGVDYCDDKVKLINQRSNFEFHKCDVEDDTQLSAFINHYNHSKPNNVFTIVLMIELLDDQQQLFINIQIMEIYMALL